MEADMDNSVLLLAAEGVYCTRWVKALLPTSNIQVKDQRGIET